MNYRNLILITLTILLSPILSVACPRVEGLIDYNCNQKLKLAFIGDSIVFGVRDNDNNGAGGYVLRLSKLFPNAEFTNLGVPGITTQEMIRKLKDGFTSTKSDPVKTKLLDADIIVIDIGRNDYWDKVHSSYSMTNIRRIVTTINEWFDTNRKVRPYILVSPLLPINTYSRNFQAPFIKALNERIIRASQLKQIKVLFRVDTLPSTILSYDGLHPYSAGYTVIAKYIYPRLKYLLSTSLLLIRPDTDKDGVYDIAETWLFKTNPKDFDTDNDTFSDGFELFTSKTSPKKASEHP
jgi:lysophospholipase L1-like esterase